MEKRIIRPLPSLIKDIVLVVIGLVLIIIVAIIFFTGISEDKKFISTTATVKTIVENDDERYIVISYEIDGVNYDNHYPYFDANLKVDDIVEIKYNPNDYNDIIARKKGYLFTSITLLFVSVFLIMYNGLLLISYLKEKKRINKLLLSDKKYEALIIAVEENDKNKLSGIVPYIIACTIKLNDKTFNLVSKDIFINADIRGYVNHYVTVYSEDDEFTNYYIDYTEVK